MAALRRLADELAVPLSSVLLAAHAKVLAALSGEREVVTGYVAAAGRPAVALPADDRTRLVAGLLLDAHRAESELLAHKDFPVDDLRRELGLTEPSFETVFDPAGDGGRLAEGTVLWVAISPQRRPARRCGCGTGPTCSTPDCAARIAGYHLTALALIAADPDAEHGRQSLLSAEELHFQLEGLAGPRRELPDRRFHELFEQRVAAHPDAVAAVHGDRQWTYRRAQRPRQPAGTSPAGARAAAARASSRW